MTTLNGGTTPAPGIYPGMPMADYHALNAASNSRLSRLRQSPAHLSAYLNEPPKDTLALRVGRAVHTAILEPDEFTTTFTIADRCQATYASGKNIGSQCVNSGILYDARDGWLCGQHSKGKTSSDDSRIVLTTDAYATCLQARDAIYRHPKAAKLLYGLKDVELTAVWVDSETGVTCKARFDGYVPDVPGGAIIDIKTCIDASLHAFERTIFARGYDLQGSLYLDGAEANEIRAEHFIHVAVEKEVAVAAVYRLKDEVVIAGRARLVQLQKLYKRCMETGEFPGYSDDIVDVGVPPWAWSRIDEEVAANV